MKIIRTAALVLAGIMLLTACGSEKEEETYERVREESVTEADTGTEENGTEEETVSGKKDEKKRDLSGRANADTGEGSIMELKEGDIAPDFTAKLSGGGEFRLSDHDDEVVLINFWATWCPPCVGEMPAFEMLKKDKIDGFAMVAVNCMEDKATVDAFVKDKGYSFNIAYDEEGTIGRYYPTDGIPYTLIVDHGVISKIYVGAQSADIQYKEYKRAIEDAMK